MSTTRTVLTTACLIAGFGLLVPGSWIYLKAEAAQYLLNRAWNISINDNMDDRYKPWPWADTWPVAKLIIPEHNIEQIVLAGDSGSALAFAPGYSLASAEPNTPGTTLISAHRDTHFAFLKQLSLHETILLQTAELTTRYRIDEVQIVDSTRTVLQDDINDQVLVLSTCYPFDTISSGGNLRYLIFARPVHITASQML